MLKSIISSLLAVVGPWKLRIKLHKETHQVLLHRLRLGGLSVVAAIFALEPPEQLGIESERIDAVAK